MQFSNTIYYKIEGYKSKWWSLFIPMQQKIKPNQNNKTKTLKKNINKPPNQQKPGWK